jgi:hypothetical protein
MTPRGLQYIVEMRQKDMDKQRRLHIAAKKRFDSEPELINRKVELGIPQ